MEHLEIEVKFFLSDPDDLRNRLLDRGARCIRPRTFETNVCYETADNRLQKSNCLLRLRKDPGTTLAFKSSPAESDPRFKVYRELEVRVNDFATMDAVLQSLGFFRRQSYEKWREIWRHNHATVCLDTLPFGCFLEIEGDADQIITITHDLGLAWEHRIRCSYLSIFAVLRDQEGLPFGDVTFDNFKSVPCRFDPYRRRFEAGDAA
jgi:adenylate cyclase, class 2